MTLPDGKTRVGTVKKGQVVWEDAGPHQPENSPMILLKPTGLN